MDAFLAYLALIAILLVDLAVLDYLKSLNFHTNLSFYVIFSNNFHFESILTFKTFIF